MTVELRHYQTAAVREVHAAYASGCKSVLLASPTGSGKGTTAVHIVLATLAKGNRAVFTAPRRVIVDDAFKRLVKAGMPPEQLGILMGDDARANPGAPAQVCSIDTLIRRDIDEPAILVIDESHMALDKCKAVAARFPRAYLLGMTATPTRADGRGLGELYSRLVVVATPSQLVADGYLVKPRVWTVPGEQLPDLSEVPKLGGDYDPGALSAASNKPRLVGSIVAHWKQRAAGARTVVFAVDRLHAQSILAEFLGAGVAAEYLDAFTTQRERDAIFARFERHETAVLCSVGTLTTGWDAPWAKCAILARATVSDGLLVQMCGRVLRPWRDETAIVLDHSGNFRVHPLPTEDREYTLEGRKARAKGPAAPVTCGRCMAVFSAGPSVCPACGTSMATEGKKRKGPRSVAGDLVEVTAAEREALAWRTPPGRRSAAQRVNDMVWRARVNIREGASPREQFAAVERKFLEEFGRPIPPDLRERHVSLRVHATFNGARR